MRSPRADGGDKAARAGIASLQLAGGSKKDLAPEGEGGNVGCGEGIVSWVWDNGA